MVQNGMSNYYLGVEIGGTKQQIAVGLADGTIIESRQVKLTYLRGAEDILDWLKENINLWLQDVRYKGKIERIGVGFGGPLESRTGRVLSSLQVPGWNNFRLKEWFEKEFTIPTVIINDTVTGGLAELYKGAGIGAEYLFYTNIGTGIGGGFYNQGRYFDGSGFGASYLGNTYVPDWTSKMVGRPIRMELLCSGRSIEKRLQTPGYVPPTSLLFEKEKGDISCITCVSLAEGVRQKDAFSVEELNHITESFSIALANVLAVLGADTVVIGGGVANMGDILFDRIRQFTEQYCFIANKGRYKILQSRLLDEAVLVGAVLAAARGGEL